MNQRTKVKINSELRLRNVNYFKAIEDYNDNHYDNDDTEEGIGGFAPNIHYKTSVAKQAVRLSSCAIIY